MFSKSCICSCKSVKYECKSLLILTNSVNILMSFKINLKTGFVIQWNKLVSDHFNEIDKQLQKHKKVNLIISSCTREPLSSSPK